VEALVFGYLGLLAIHLASVIEDKPMHCLSAKSGVNFGLAKLFKSEGRIEEVTA
jgi:hypothetical protein